MCSMASGVSHPSCSWATWSIGISADLGTGYRAIRSFARLTFSGVSRAISGGRQPSNW